MNRYELRRGTAKRLLAGATAWLLVQPVAAERIHFRVAFEHVPGLEEIEAGNLDAGIRILEEQLDSDAPDNDGDVLATLCAAHIVNGTLSEAERVCDKAIKVKPGNTAYNNRGVLRAHTGYLAGAREDFARVRPQELDVYLEQLWTTDVPLLANSNFELVDKMLNESAAPRIRRSFAASGSKIEEITE